MPGPLPGVRRSARPEMAELVALSPSLHRRHRWRRSSGFGFARAAMTVPVVLGELKRATLSLPLGFLRENDVLFPVALLGLREGENLFVDADGTWRGRYIPAQLRAHPFRLVAREGSAHRMLCIEADALVEPDENGGEPLFDREGNPVPFVAQTLDFLERLEQDRERTLIASQALADAQVIRDWPIEVETAAGRLRLVGLHRVDADALAALPDEAFLALRDSGALKLAFCQTLAMENLQLLGDLFAGRRPGA